MTLVDPEDVDAILRQTAREVILPRYRHLAAAEIRQKKPGDYVTIADTEAERLLTRRLGELLPGAAVVGEEAVAADAAVLRRLDGDGPVWIIDPVDGTSNFAQGHPLFCVIVALVSGGRTVQGWIHDPLNDRTAIAALGEGAWIGGQRLRVAAEGALAEMRGSAGYRRNPALTAATGGLLNQGSAGHDYLALAEGRLHFAWFRRLHPWDHAAGVLLHGEAGGYAALTDGRPYRPVFSESALLLAPGRASWENLHRLLTPSDAAHGP